MPIVIPSSPSPFEGGGPPLDTHQEIVAGDDYKAVDGRALRWESTKWTDLAGSTLSMIVGHTQYNLYGNLPITITGSVPSSPASPTIVSLDVSGVDTANLPAGQYDYQLDATLMNADKVTVAIGHLSVQATPGTVPLYPPAV